MGDGALLTLLPRREYDFSGLDTNGSIQFPIAKDIAVEPWSAGQLLVRVHGVTRVGASQVSVLDSLPAAEDPDEDFTASSSLASLALGVAAPALKLATLDLSGVGFITVLLQGSRSTLSGAISVTISVDLVARSPN